MTTRNKIGITVVLIASLAMAGYGIWHSGLLEAWPYAAGAAIAARQGRG